MEQRFFHGSILALSAGLFVFLFALFRYFEFGALLWGAAFLALLFWAVAVGLWLFFAPMSRNTVITCLLIAASSLVLALVNPWSILGTALFSLFLLWALYAVKEEQDLLRRVKIGRIMQRGMTKVVIGFLLLFSIVYGASVAQLIEERGEIVPEAVIRLLVPEITVEEFQRSINATVLRSFEGELRLDEAVLEEPLSSYLYARLNESMRDIIEPFTELAPVFLVAGSFLVLRILSIPFLWIALALLWICVRQLFSLGKLEIRTREGELEETMWKS